eukprot:evm.model.scf_1092.5 EVM.evm.TU.scf_1092.5   scf_1092:38183-40563(-)
MKGGARSRGKIEEGAGGPGGQQGAGATELPRARHAACQRRVNDEDMLCVREGLTLSPAGASWSLYCLCDGHGGALAANYAMGNLWRVLSPLLPTARDPTWSSADFDIFALEVRKAVVAAFVKIGEQFRTDVSADNS